MLPSKITKLRREELVDVTGDTLGTADPENDAAVLESAIGIPESCPCYANFGSQDLRYKFAQAIGVHNFNIIVEKKKDRSAGATGSEINQAAEIKFAGALDNLNPLIVSETAVQFTRLHFHAVVFQNDDLEIRVIAYVQNTVDALREQ